MKMEAVFLVIAVWLFVASYARADLVTNKMLVMERASPFPTNVELAVEAKARDERRHKRGDVVSFPLDGAFKEAGLYFVRIQLGSPPQEMRVDIDTGSDNLWVRCKDCIGCSPSSSQLPPPPPPPGALGLSLFDPAGSSSASKLSCTDKLCHGIGSTHCENKSNPCGLHAEYGDGSFASGYYLTDALHFQTPSLAADSSSPQIVFGCATDVEGVFTSRLTLVDGIMGLSRSYPSVVSQLSTQQLIPGIFSHCLSGNGGGILVFGQIQDATTVYTPLLSKKGHYSVDLENITLNGRLLPISPDAYKTSHGRRIIVDSGTTMAYLVSDIYDGFITAVNLAVSQIATLILQEGNQCYKLPTSGINDFPSISFNFNGGAFIILTPNDYLLNNGLTDDGILLMCMGVHRSPDLFDDLSVLGDLVLKDRIVVYDIVHEQLGLAIYDCSTLLVNVTEPSEGDYMSVAPPFTVARSYYWIIVLLYFINI